jgi:hypothetical protein
MHVTIVKIKVNVLVFFSYSLGKLVAHLTCRVREASLACGLCIYI